MTEDIQSTPAMESVRSFFNGASDVGGQLIDGAMHPAARPLVGGFTGIFALVIAWKFAPMLFEKFIPGDNMLSGGIRGLLSFGLAMAVGMGGFELGNNGFDIKKTGSALAKDWNIAVDMGANGASWLDDKVTGGRFGDTIDASKDALRYVADGVASGVGAADEATGRVASRGLDAVAGKAKMAWEVSKATGAAALDMGGRAADAVGDGVDYAINHDGARSDPDGHAAREKARELAEIRARYNEMPLTSASQDPRLQEPVKPMASLNFAPGGV
ncbi:MAG: hypothetical protein H6867_05430 [Rhodospirillales bacterium]|nr:hypothetical protein [Rhodospirillales bacterium]MCB9994971.1 hypothetical protein [Rhodospirillales bacterium]